MLITNGVLLELEPTDIVDKTLVIPEGVTKIAKEDIHDITPYLRKVIFPKSMRVIGNCAFTGCNNLTQIELNEGLEEIEEAAFCNCKSLEEIELPSTLKKIRPFAFHNSYLTSIKIPGKVKEIGRHAFSGSLNLEKVIIEEGVTSIGEKAFEGCLSLNEVIFPNSLLYILNKAFDGCEKLENIDLPKKLEILGRSAFTDCTNLKKVNIPEGVTTIERAVFNNCKNLKEIILNKNIRLIKKYAFHNCHSLQKIILPENLESLGDFCFECCYSLEEIILPKKLKEIPHSAFIHCYRLKKITFPENLEEIESFAFSDCRSLQAITLPNSLKEIGIDAFNYCNSLEEISIGGNVKTIGENALDNLRNVKKLITPWGEYTNNNFSIGNVVVIYMYLFSNHILKEKYEDVIDFLSDYNIKILLDGIRPYISRNDGIALFKTLFSKLRREYDITPNLFKYLNKQTAIDLTYPLWNRIKNLFSYELNQEMSKAFAEMIEVFGLFKKDDKLENRIRTFNKLINEQDYQLPESIYNLVLDNCVLKYFNKKESEVFKIKVGIEIPDEFTMYLTDTINWDKRKKIKKITGTYGKRLNDFIMENYEIKKEVIYQLNELGKESPHIKLFRESIPGYLSERTIHQIFDGCSGLYDEDFYHFFIENLPFILENEEIQSSIKEIQKNFEAIKIFYLIQSGNKKVTLNQALDYINQINLSYRFGNLELVKDAQKAGVTNQEAFDYYQEVYEQNQIRRKRSLLPRSNIYEINGYQIKAELLRKDDPFTLFVGEKNYTNCCQVYRGIGHNCMAHATKSEDGGIFVTKVLVDGKWILLTESWDWQNNNLYCHDNIEGTPYLKKAPKDLKKAVAEVFRLDAEFIIEESEKEIEKYIARKKKCLEKEQSKTSEEIEQLKNHQTIKAVTVGTGYDDLGLKNFFNTPFYVNGEQFINGQRFTLSNFQPIKYNISKPYFDQNFEAYSDAKNTQYILAGSLENLSLKEEELTPIYKDQRRILLEDENIREYTAHKIANIEEKAYPTEMRDYQSKNIEKLSESVVYLGEDWYLIYEKKEDGNIYISDLARIEPVLEEERGIQQKEILSTLSTLINSSNEIEADLKEDTSYILYLMNKRLGYIEQIGEDIAYPFDRENESRTVSEEEQENILKNRKENKQDKNNKVMHKILFKKSKKEN